MGRRCRRGILVAAVLGLGLHLVAGGVARGQILNPKRGFGDVGANYANLQATGAGWYYTWGSGTGSPGNFGAKHYPMFWNSPSDATINAVKNRPGVEWVLGFNEPERTDQANMSVTSALDAWSRICNAFAGTSVKLASPAVSDNTAGRAWIADFMAQLEDRRTNTANAKHNPNLRVDAMAFHWYGSSSPNNPTEAANWFIGSVDYYRSTYGVGVMPTEFAIHDWGGVYTDQQITDANKLFLDNVLPRLDSRSYVPGYAWYHWFTDARLYSGSPATPTPMAHRYVGAIGTGSTANIGGQNLGEYAAYLTGGSLTMTGTAPGTVKYISALANTSTVTGGMNWGLTGTSTWLRVEPDATLRKTGTNRLTFDGTRITNSGALDVATGAVWLTGSTTVAGTGTIRVGSGGTLAIEQAAGTFALDAPLELAGGTIDSIMGSLRLTGTSAVFAQTTLVGSGTTTLAGPLINGSVAGGITKTGSGLLVISSAANSYSGPTRVTAGMLAVAGRIYTGGVGTDASIAVTTGTLFTANFSDQPTGSLGNLPGSSDRISVDGGTLRIAGSGSTARGFTVGPGGATVELQAGVNLSFLESNAAARIVSPAGGGLTLNATTGSGTLAKAYVGTGGLLKTGTGTWTITGNNTFAGDTRILAGTLRVTGTASLAGSTLDLNAADTGTITFASGSARTFSLGGLAGTRSLSSGSHTLRIGGNGQTTVYSGSLDGVGGLVKTGTGMLSLGGITTLTGGVVVEEGILRFTGSASMPTAGPIRIDSGGTLAPVAGAAVDAWLSAGRIDTASAGAIAISGSLGAALDLRDFPGLSLGGSGTATFGGSLLPGASGYRLGGGDGSLVVSAVLGGMHPLMKVGADTVILTGMNSFSGGILLRGGLLQAGSEAALGSSGTISFQGGGLQSSAANAADFSGRFSRSAGQDFRIDTNGRSITFAEPLVSAGGSLTKLGSGTLAIAATNGFDGTTRIVEGVLQVAGTAALAAATLDLNVADAGTLALVAGSPQTFVIGGLEGSRNLATAGHTLRLGGNGRSTTYGGVISGSGGLVKEAAGTLALAGSNSYTGGTVIAAGVLQIGAGGTSGGVAGAIQNNASLVFDRAGVLIHAGAISGTGSLTKRGPGTVALSGTSTFTGPMRVEEGMLQVTGLVAAGSRLTMAGGTFASGRPGGVQALTGGALSAADSAISTTAATGTLALGGLTRETGATVTFTSRTGPITTTATASSGILGAWAFTGSGTGTLYATVAGGTIAPYTAAAVMNSTSAFGGIPSGDTGTANYNVTSSGTFAAMGLARIVNTIDYSGNGGVQPAANAVTLTVNGIMNTGAGPLTIGGSPLMDVVIGSSRELVVNTVTDDVVFRNAVLDHAGGTSSLTKAGPGTLVLNGSNGFTGRTTVAGGTLRIGTGGTGAFLASSSIVNRGTLVFDHVDGLNLAGGLAGDGVVRKAGAGELTLTGTGGFAGELVIESGALVIGGAGSLGPRGELAGGVTVAAGARLLHDSSAEQTFAGSVGGDGDITAAGGRLVLAAANAFTGDVTVDSGATLVLAHPKALAGQAEGRGIALGNTTGSVIELATDGSGPRPLLQASNGFSTTIVAGRPLGSTGPGLRHELSAGLGLSGGVVNVQSATSVTSGNAEVAMPFLSLTAGAAAAITRIQPTTAIATIGGVASTINAVPKTLDLAGTSHGNTVTGGIEDGVSVVSLVKSGTGSWTLSAATTFTGTTTLSAGTLRIAHPGALAGSAAVRILGGRVALPGDTPLATTLKSLAIDEAGGMLDLGIGRVTVAAGGITSADLRRDLLAGRGSGGWDGAGGISSSAAAANRAVGVSRSVGWLNHDDGSFTVSYAAAGDSNIDGVIDLLDVADVLAAGVFDTGLDASWQQGDFNYDGLADILDAAEFISTGLYDAGGYVSSAAPGGAVAAVPEPSVLLAVLAACGAAAAGRRVSRRS